MTISKQTGKSAEKYEFPALGPEICTSIGKISDDHYEDAIREVLTYIRDLISVDIAGLVCCSDSSDQSLQIDTHNTRKEGQTVEVFSFREKLPFLTKLIWEQKAFSISGLHELPGEAETDRSFLRDSGINALCILPIQLCCKKKYGLYAFSFSGRNWDIRVIDLLRFAGTLLVSALERVELTRDISESEEKFRTVADFTFDLERWYLPDGKLDYITPSCEKITGYTREEFLNDPNLFTRLVYPEDSLFYRNIIENYAATREYPGMEFRIIRKDGDIRWIESRGSNVIDKKGIFQGLRISSRDITDRKNAEQELKEAYIRIENLEKQYKTIAEYSVNMDIWILSDGTFTYVSPSVEKITGYPADHFRNSTDIISLIIHPEDKQETVSIFAEWFSRRKDFNGQYRIVTRNGEIKWMETAVRVIFNEEAKLVGYLLSSRDNTEGILLREELKRSEEKFRHIVQEQTDLICEFSPEGTLIFANEAYKLAYDLKEEELKNFNCFTVLPPEERDKVNVLMLKLKPEQPVSEDEYRIIRPDGTVAWEHWVTKGIFSSSGELTGALGVGRDITEKKNMGIRLENAFKEIRELNEKLKAENIYLKDRIITKDHASGIFTHDPEMIRVLNMVQKVAKTDSPVLIIGETGTGKEMIARHIHELSNRRQRMMVTVNCGAIPPSLIESELFGREKGAFTGAMTKQSGRFELADKSTLFLDEIAELPSETQSKLLRVLQFGEYQMLGSSVTRRVNVRLIAATNRNLTEAVKEGSFRKDLFYRLDVFPIHIPPLRERKADIPGLVWQFVEEFSGIMGKRIESISKKSMEKLTNYTWPGNVRELRNIIEYSMILCDSPDLKINLRHDTSESESSGSSLADSERRHIINTMEKTGWRIRGKGGAAELLDLPESTLRSRMKKLGIHHQK